MNVFHQDPLQFVSAGKTMPVWHSGFSIYMFLISHFQICCWCSSKKAREKKARFYKEERNISFSESTLTFLSNIILWKYLKIAYPPDQIYISLPNQILFFQSTVSMHHPISATILSTDFLNFYLKKYYWATSENASLMQQQLNSSNS